MSTRLTALEPGNTTGKTRELLDTVQSKMKMVPNVLRTMANSPAALQGYLSFADALSHGKLTPKLRSLIAITVAEANHCEYCLSAHIAIGKSLGLTDKDFREAQIGKASDPKMDTAVRFALLLVTRQGKVSDTDLQKIKTAGFTEEEIAEIIANVSLNIYTNYFNHVARTAIDFPKSEFLTEKSV